MLANEELFGPELLDFEYLLIDVARYTEEELLSLSNTIGSVFLLDQTEDQDQLLARLGKLMHTIRQLPEESQQQFTAWMANILSQKLPSKEPHLQELIWNVKGEVSVMGLEKILDDIERKGKLEGILEGKREGILEGKREGILEGKLEGKREAREEIAKNMIRMGMDTTSIVQATGITEKRVEELRELGNGLLEQ